MEANSLQEIIENHPMYASIAVQYFRPKQRTYARDAFQAFIRDLVDAHNLDFETDAVQVCTFASAAVLPLTSSSRSIRAG